MVTTVTNNSPKAINTSLFSLEKEIEDIEKRVNSLIKLVSGINTGGSVISVNGQQGIVELDAADVGALPDTTVVPDRTSQLTNDSGFITASQAGGTFVPVTRTVNEKALNQNITIDATDLGLGNVVNTGDSAIPVSGGTTKFTTGGAYTELAKKIDVAEKGVANGVAELDATGRVPYSQLPESAMEYEGTWDASTNTPTLADGIGTNGDFYVVSAGGTVNFGTVAEPRNVTFYVNDRVIYDGTLHEWERLPAGEVRSVNGQTGDVVLTIPPAQVQSDWNETDPNSMAYIQNKPNIPSGVVVDDAVTDGDMNAVTSNAVYDALLDKVSKAGDTVTGAIMPSSDKGCNFGGASNRFYYGYFYRLYGLQSISNATSGNNLTLPSKSGTLATTADITAKGLTATKTDNAIARWDGTDGALQNSGVSIDDSNNVSTGATYTSSQNNNSSWWVNKNPRGKFVGSNGGTTSGWSPLLAGKTVNGKYELGSLNNTVYLNYYKDSRTTNGIDKTIFDYTQDGTPNWNGNASSASDSSKLNGYSSDTSATANTIVRRTANGYVNAAIFHDGWSAENISSYTSNVVFRSSDGYLRNTSLANFKSWFGKANSASSADSAGNATKVGGYSVPSTKGGTGVLVATSSQDVATGTGNGYVKLSNNLLICWGTVSLGTVNHGVSGSKDITLQSYGNTYYSAQVTQGASANSGLEVAVVKGNSSITVKYYNRNSSTNIANCALNWFTIGWAS